MIFLYTDFSDNGPYVGELKSVMLRQQTDHEVVDLMHDAPVFNPKASAYLLAALAARFRKGDACLGVIDPEVGSSNRRPIIVVADGITYCGPDNGLFSQIIRQAKSVEVFEILWRPKNLSNSFHGRDLFAPALISFLKNQELKVNQMQPDKLIGHDWPDSQAEIIYIDRYGNCVTGISAKDISKKQSISFNNYSLKYARTFSELRKGKPFWYINSMNLVEISVNQGNAAEFFRIHTGLKLTVR